MLQPHLCCSLTCSIQLSHTVQLLLSGGTIVFCLGRVCSFVLSIFSLRLSLTCKLHIKSIWKFVEEINFQEPDWYLHKIDPDAFAPFLGSLVEQGLIPNVKHINLGWDLGEETRVSQTILAAQFSTQLESLSLRHVLRTRVLEKQILAALDPNKLRHLSILNDGFVFKAELKDLLSNGLKHLRTLQLNLYDASYESFFKCIASVPWPALENLLLQQVPEGFCLASSELPKAFSSGNFPALRVFDVKNDTVSIRTTATNFFGSALVSHPSQWPLLVKNSAQIFGLPLRTFRFDSFSSWFAVLDEQELEISAEDWINFYEEFNHDESTDLADPTHLKWRCRQLSTFIDRSERWRPFGVPRKLQGALLDAVLRAAKDLLTLASATGLLCHSRDPIAILNPVSLLCHNAANAAMRGESPLSTFFFEFAKECVEADPLNATAILLGSVHSELSLALLREPEEWLNKFLRADIGVHGLYTSPEAWWGSPKSLPESAHAAYPKISLLEYLLAEPDIAPTQFDIFRALLSNRACVPEGTKIAFSADLQLGKLRSDVHVSRALGSLCADWRKIVCDSQSFDFFFGPAEGCAAFFAAAEGLEGMTSKLKKEIHRILLKRFPDPRGDDRKWISNFMDHLVVKETSGSSCELS